MKKLISIFLAMMMLLVALAACGSTEQETEGAGTVAETQGTAAETVLITEQSESSASTEAVEESEGTQISTDVIDCETETETETIVCGIETESEDDTEVETEPASETETKTESTLETDTETQSETESESESETGVIPDEEEILFFTPTLDGLLDDAYLKSACLVGDITTQATWASAPVVYDTPHWVYFLWDGDYIYICAVVYDADLVTRGAQYCLEAVGENPYCNDSFEIRYVFNDEYPYTEHDDLCKIGLDPWNYKLFSAANEGVMSAYFEDCEAIATKYIDDENPDNSYYICEFKLPAKKEPNLDKGETVGADLDIGDMLWFGSQINDIERGEESGVLPSENSKAGFKYTQGAQSGNARPNPATGETNSYAYLMLSDVTVEEVDASVARAFPVREATE